MAENKDRIKKYLVSKLDEYLFDELSDAYLEKAGVTDILKGVPVPFKKRDLANPTTSSLAIAGSMAFVIGCDPGFRYRDNYLAFIKKSFGEEFAKPVVGQAVKAAEDGDFETAVILFRAALALDPLLRDALYGFARACHDAYEDGDDPDYIGDFKAESLRAFEKLTSDYPDFAPGFYYLGYAYLNLGLYMKAKLTFDDFLRSNEDAELRAEITKLEEKLVDPCRIEEGYNAVLSGRYEAGIDILSIYEDDERFNVWWPLWYYLGVAYMETGDAEEAKKKLLNVLKYSPSNTDAMSLLVEIYEAEGNAEKAKKYADKIGIVNANAELDREEKRKEQGSTVS